MAKIQTLQDHGSILQIASHGRLFSILNFPRVSLGFDNFTRLLLEKQGLFVFINWTS